MRNQNIILDTSVLVALINRSDSNHIWAVQEWMQLKSPALTCEAVISETCFLQYSGQISKKEGSHQVKCQVTKQDIQGNRTRFLTKEETM